MENTIFFFTPFLSYFPPLSPPLDTYLPYLASGLETIFFDVASYPVFGEGLNFLKHTRICVQPAK